MSFVERTGGPRLAPLDQGLKTPPPTPKETGRLQGRGVEVLNKTQTVKVSALTEQLKPQKPPRQHTTEKASPPYTLMRQARYGAVSTKDQLITKAGRPKDDISFGFLGTKKMSTGYKAILGGLDRYQETFKNDSKLRGSDKQGTDSNRLDALMHQLDGLGDATGKYMKAGGHSRKQEIGEIQSQVAHDKEVVKGLQDEVSKGAKFPDKMHLSEIVDYARQGISLKDMPGLYDKGLSPKGARDEVDFQNARVALKNAYAEAGLKVDQSKLDGLARTYVAMNIPITPQTIVKGFTDGMLSKAMEPLGKGAFNSVFTAKYRTPDGKGFDGVFKPLSPPDNTRTHRVERGWVASKTGIDLYNPQIAMRNLSTCDVAKSLGFNVVPHTEIGSRTPPPPPPNQPPQLGLVMSRAQGLSGGKSPEALFGNSDVRREVTKLQLLDHLVGQGDRHGNNYFINVDSNGKVTVTGIDNDQCFGKDLHDPNGIAYGRNKKSEGFRGTLMPPVIDTEMAKAFEDMTPDSLEATLTGKLTPEEITAAKDRLAGIKEHIATLRSTGMIIRPDQWGSDKVTNALNRSNSYVARDLAPQVDTLGMFGI